MKGIVAWLLSLLFVANQPQRTLGAASERDQRARTLAAAVVDTLRHEHRGGSLIYRGRCIDSLVSDIYPVVPLKAPMALNESLDDIVKKYPSFRWVDFGSDAVRIFDSSANTALLNLRVKQFHLQQVTNPDLAISSLWNLPEVKSFARAHHITFMAISLGAVPLEGAYTPITVDVHDATIAEIMDKISQSYRLTSDPSWRSVWIYHECETRRGMIVELDVM